MPDDDISHLPITLDVRGTVSTWDPVTGAEISRVIIQRSRAEQANARTASGIPVIVRPYQIPRDPKRPAQLARREIHAAGVAAWQADPDAARAASAAEAEERNISPFMAWMAQWHRNHPSTTTTDWDDGATDWDGGATTWD